MALDPSRDLVDRVRAIAERAGVAVMEVYDGDFEVEHKDDSSPVTAADERAEALILAGLRDEIATPLPIVAEEEVAAGRVPEVEGTAFWLVDPLDGTKQFVSRRGEFTVNIALVEDGLPILGVVHAPVVETTWWASRHGAFVRKGKGEAMPIAVRPAPAGGIVAVVSRSHRTPETDRLLARYVVAEEITSGSSVKFCLIAEGRADLYPRMGRTMEWDTAAGHAVVRFAGGRVETLDGAELRYGKPDFANPHFLVRGG